MSRPRTYPDLTPRQKDYIESNCARKTVYQMAASRHIPTRMIYAYMEEKGLKTLDPRSIKKETNPDYFNWKDYNDCVL